MSSTHKLDGSGNISKMANSNKTEVPRGLAAGGWTASARDMVRLMVSTDKLSNYPDILKPATIDLMETKPFPTVSGSHALGWGMQPKGAGKKLAHNGKVGGGTAQIVKFTSGYTATDGTDLSNINIAICTNGNVSTSALNELAGEIAKVTGKETIPAAYDLFLTNSYDIIWPDNDKVTGVFLEKPTPSVLRVCESWPDFTDTWSTFGKKGFQLIDIETIKMNGKIRYSGVWEKDAGKQALYQYDSWDKFTKKWDELSKTGYRLIDIARFETNGQSWYAGVWKEGKGNYALYQFNWQNLVYRRMAGR